MFPSLLLRAARPWSAGRMADRPLTGDRVYRNEAVRISALTVSSTTLMGLEFTNCRIIGPAILGFISGVTLVASTYDAPGLEAVFWEVAPERGPVVGIVAVIDCTFSNCTFEWIGWAARPTRGFPRRFQDRNVAPALAGNSTDPRLTIRTWVTLTVPCGGDTKLTTARSRSRAGFILDNHALLACRAFAARSSEVISSASISSWSIFSSSQSP